MQNAQIALELLGLAGRAMVGTGMNHVQRRPRHFAAGRPDRRQDLLVNAMVESQVGPVAEQLHMVDHRDVEIGLAVIAVAGTVNLHRESQNMRRDVAIGQGTQPATAFQRNRVIGIHPEDPVARACRTDSFRAAEKSSHHGK